MYVQPLVSLCFMNPKNHHLSEWIITLVFGGKEKSAKHTIGCISAINKSRVRRQKLLELLIWLAPLFKKFYQALIRSLIASVLINLTFKKLITLILTQSISSPNYHFTTISIMPPACRANDFQRGWGFTGSGRGNVLWNPHFSVKAAASPIPGFRGRYLHPWPGSPEHYKTKRKTKMCWDSCKSPQRQENCNNLKYRTILFIHVSGKDIVWEKRDSSVTMVFYTVIHYELFADVCCYCCQFNI